MGEIGLETFGLLGLVLFLGVILDCKAFVSILLLLPRRTSAIESNYPCYMLSFERLESCSPDYFSFLVKLFLDWAVRLPI